MKWAVGLLLIPSYVYADSACRDVYINATRDISTETRTYQELDYVFDNYCNADGSTKSFTMNDKVKLVFDDLPIDLQSDKNFTEKRVSEFCRSYSNQRYVFNRFESYKNDVQVAALTAFNQCMDFESRGIEFASTAVGMTAGTISGTFRNRTSALTINAVIYDSSLLSCEISSEGITKSPDLLKRVAFPVAKNFTVSCDRKAQKQAGTIFYPPSDVRLETNEGAYSLHLDGDALNDFFSANSAKKLVDEANAKRDAEKNNVSTLLNNIDNANVRMYRFYDGDPGGDSAVSGPRLNCVDPKDYIARTCGNGRAFAVQLFGTGGGRCGYAHFNLACLDIDKSIPVQSQAAIPFFTADQSK